MVEREQTYSVTTSYSFFEPTEEGIDYLHNNFERVYAGDTSLTNICYSEQAHFQVEEQFVALIDEGPKDGEDLLLEAAAAIANNNGIKVFIVDGRDYLYPTTNERSQLDLSHEIVTDLFGAISESDSIDEVKLVNLHICYEDSLNQLIEGLGERLSEKEGVLKLNMENCTITDDAFDMIISTVSNAHIRISNCNLLDDNALVTALRQHAAQKYPEDTTLKFIVIDNCNLTAASVTELVELDKNQNRFHIKLIPRL